MSPKFTTIIGVAMALSLPLAAQAEGDPAQGRQKAETCLGCHGIPNYENVYPAYMVPKLGGQNAQYVLDALKAYASGDRPHVTMHAQASSLSEQDMQDIAAYFASQGG